MGHSAIVHCALGSGHWALGIVSEYKFHKLLRTAPAGHVVIDNGAAQRDRARSGAQ